MSIIAIRQLVAPDQLSQIRKTIADGPYVAAAPAAAAPAAATDLRPNLQLDPRTEGSNRAGELVVAACQNNPTFMAATWIEAMLTPTFSRYQPGMSTGVEVGAAFVGTPPNQLRCDIEVTVFLADGSSYDGGEILIDGAGIPRRWKGDAGDCLIYPADMPRRIEPVTRGTLDLAVFWIQSMVRDPAQRRILFDIKETLDELDGLTPVPTHTESLRRGYFNLIRMWA